MKYHNPDLALLLLRLGLSVVFLGHGIAKLNDLPGTVAYFAALGLPAVMAYFIAVLETVAGAAVLMGVFTRLSALGLAATMVGAIVTTKGQGGIGSFEFEFILLIVSLALALIGPGKYAVKR
ncbi:MAG TPA: DoxX family protein [Candidatus Paceibacterota bacterium]|nr:DoxX family protein [Candidatus Paceibacterota bacterium]